MIADDLLDTTIEFSHCCYLRSDKATRRSTSAEIFKSQTGLLKAACRISSKPIGAHGFKLRLMIYHGFKSNFTLLISPNRRES